MGKQTMLPGEYMKASLVTVWPESPLGMEPGFGAREVATGMQEFGQEELRPRFYVPMVRRNANLQWHVELLEAKPIEDGQIPHEVLERIVQMRDRIIKEGRSDRGKEQALARKGESVDSRDSLAMHGIEWED